MKLQNIEKESLAETKQPDAALVKNEKILLDDEYIFIVQRCWNAKVFRI